MSTATRRSIKSRVLSLLSRPQGRITSRQMVRRFNVVHPRSVIAKLRKDGYQINTAFKTRSGSKYAVYSLNPSASF